MTNMHDILGYIVVQWWEFAWKRSRMKPILQLMLISCWLIATKHGETEQIFFQNMDKNVNN